jgi:cytochrome b subunit of formate dehydrogenase/nitrate/TMAO reductase-like tetraheme cytochrome c subunit
MMTKRRMSWAAPAAAALVAAVVGVGPVRAQAPAPDPGACAACHDSEAVVRATVLPHSSSSTCLDCHHLGATRDPAVAAARRLDACASCHEPEATTAVHGAAEGVTCLGCHSIHGAQPLARSAESLSARCASCHETPHTLHADVPAGEGPLCTSCHSLHEIDAPLSGPAQVAVPVHGSEAGEVAGTCASCHEGVHPSHPETGPNAVSCTSCHELDATEPLILDESRLEGQCASCHEDDHATHLAVDEGAPGCTDCHAMADDPPLAELSARAMADRCGACHEDELDEFLAGGHAHGLTTEKLNPGIPTCVTCHEAMLHDQGGAPGRLSAAGGCISCHGDEELAEDYGLSTDVVKSYLEDYHGATVDFLKDEAGADSAAAVLTCADCHGMHSVGWNEEAVVAEVCLDCHEEADPKLAGAWLGHGRPGPDNQVMTWLVGLFYYFLIPFMLVGLGLIIIYELVHGVRHGARPWKAEGARNLARRLLRKDLPPRRMVTRFSVRERIEHAATVTVFLTLVVTGLPQLRPDLRIAHEIIALFGGIGATRLVHRIAGFTFVALLVIHVATAVIRAIRKRRMPVMLPTLDDFDDAIGTVRHFIRGTPRPKVGKFDFAQKFEYGGMLMGGVVMCATGLVLIYPEVATLLIPGEWVAAFRAMHGYEATFATLVVVLWHSWGVVFRPEVFPLDTSIFTGKVTVERLKEEHWREYERLFPEEAAREAAAESTEVPRSNPRPATVSGPELDDR